MIKVKNKYVSRVLLIGANWCIPCSILKNKLDKLKIQYTYIDIDDQPEMAKLYDVKSLPSCVIDGKLYDNSIDIIIKLKEL